MSHSRFTLDYLLEIIAELHRRKHVILAQFPNRTETQRIMTGLFRLGIVKKDHKVSRALVKLSGSGSGRPHVVYSLAVPYETIRLGDVYHLVTDLSGIRLQLCKLGRDVLLPTLEKMRPLDVSLVRSMYSARVLVGGLARLSNASYQKHEDMVSPDFPWHDRQWLSDMTALKVVKNKYGLGYRLARPLKVVKISEILPYVCYRSPRRQTYNKLFSLFKNKPVSILLPSEATVHQLG